MIEKLIVLEDIDPVIFYGVNNANIQLIKALYPKLRIVARGNVIKVLGDEEEISKKISPNLKSTAPNIIH